MGDRSVPTDPAGSARRRWSRRRVSDRRAVERDGIGARDGRVRLLLECASRESPSLIASLLERLGYDVQVCEGPAAVPCTLVEEGTCPLVEQSDVVVNLLGPGTAHEEIAAVVSSLPGPPLVLASLHGQPLESPSGTVRIPGVLTRHKLAAGVRCAIGSVDASRQTHAGGGPRA